MGLAELRLAVLEPPLCPGPADEVVIYDTGGEPREARMDESSPCLSALRSAPIGLFLFLAAGGAGAVEAVPAGSGTFTVGTSRYTFADAVAFQTTRLNSAPGERVTVVVLTPDPIDRKRVAAAVAADGNWAGSEHKVRFTLRFDSRGKLAFGMFQGDAKNIGLMRLATIAAELSAADGLAKGRAALPQPADFLGEPYTFEVSFQAPVVARP
jgi:hypothetical protein